MFFALFQASAGDVDDICVLLGYYAAKSDNSGLTFRDYVSVQSSMIKPDH
jgi:hypothetical protein